MRLVVTVILGALLMVPACKKQENKGETPASAEKAVDAPAAAVDYTAVDELIKNAKTSDDFLNVIGACGKLQLDAATSGKELDKDPAFIEHCKWNPVKAKAERAVSESKPGQMATVCLSASMGLEELATAGIHADEATALNTKVKTACGL